MEPSEAEPFYRKKKGGLGCIEKIFRVCIALLLMFFFFGYPGIRPGRNMANFPMVLMISMTMNPLRYTL